MVKLSGWIALSKNSSDVDDMCEWNIMTALIVSGYINWTAWRNAHKSIRWTKMKYNHFVQNS